jgi:hypothetical protein
MSIIKFLLVLITANTICMALNLSKIERIQNGSFEMGMTDYNTDYVFTNMYLHIEGYYTLTRNPNQVYTAFSACSDHTTGTGNMIVFNGSEKPGAIVWEQVVNPIEKNRDYYFSYWATSVILKSPAKLTVYINDMPLNQQPDLLPDIVCDWTQFGFYWNSGNATLAKITIKNENTEFFGNDFALDDISFKAVCIEGEIAGKDNFICFGDSYTLGMQNPPQDSRLQWKWAPSNDLSADNIPNPVFTGKATTRYYLELTDPVIECKTYDTVDIEVAPEIPKVLTTDKSGVICPCDSITISGPDGDFSYLWSTGETSRSIIIRNSGTYSLSVRNKLGCEVSMDSSIEIINSIIDLSIDSVAVNTGDTAKVNIRITNPIVKDKCVPSGYSINLRYPNSTLTPIENNHQVTDNGDYSEIAVTGNNFDNFLAELKFLVTLGKEPDINLEILKADFGCDDIKISKVNGAVKLKDLCNQPTYRLFKDTDELFLALKSGNPVTGNAEIEFRTIEKGFVEVQLYNSIGNLVSKTTENCITPGIYSLDLDMNSFTSGFYYLVLRTPTISSSIKLNVLK